MKIIEFAHDCNPPKSTAQQRQFFKRGNALTPSAKKAAATWQAIVEQHKPAKPLAGTIRVTVILTWHKKDLGGTPRTKKPDLDNVAKLLLDAMTKTGYWLDDKQVYDLHLMKFDGPFPGVIVRVVEED